MTRPRRGDLVAGVTVAMVLVPQSIAYAALAGLPPQAGLYAAAAAPLMAAPVGSSPYLQTGPVALTSLLVVGALSPVASPGAGSTSRSPPSWPSWSAPRASSWASPGPASSPT